MNSRSAPFAARALEPLQSVIWVLFLTWTAIAFLVMPFDIGEAQARDWIPQAHLRELIIGFLALSDAIWFVLAASVVYLHLAEAEGLSTARRWALIIIVGSAVIQTIGAISGLPFGPFDYTSRFGVRLAGVLPFTIPLAWLVIVVCGRWVVLAVAPRAGRFAVAGGTGLVALLTDLNLEPVAWKVRAYWIWYPAQLGAPDYPPVQNYVSWFLAAALFTLAYPQRRVEMTGAGVQWRPITVLALINAVFLTVHIVRWVRS